MAPSQRWVALGYNVPANPSKKRVYIWRKLRDFGAEYFRPGVAVLPYTKTNLTRLRHLAAKIDEMGGESSMVELSFLDPKDEAELIARFKAHSSQEYQKLLLECKKAMAAARAGGTAQRSEQHKEALQKMARAYKQARARDYFASDLPQDVEEVLGLLREYIACGADDFFDRLIRVLDS